MADWKEVLRVLVLEEGAIDRKVYVAQALEQDMATQVSPGESLQGVIEALGFMFDASDKIRAEHPDAEPIPRTPQAYWDGWQNNSFRIGLFDLGAKRMADVRLLRDSYAIAVGGRKPPELLKRT